MLKINDNYQELYKMVEKEVGTEAANKIMGYKFFSSWGFGYDWKSRVLRRSIYKTIMKNPDLSEEVREKAEEWMSDKDYFVYLIWVMLIVIVVLFLIQRRGL
jgi:hypothetical protein